MRVTFGRAEGRGRGRGRVRVRSKGEGDLRPDAAQPLRRRARAPG